MGGCPKSPSAAFRLYFFYCIILQISISIAGAYDGGRTFQAGATFRRLLAGSWQRSATECRTGSRTLPVALLRHDAELGAIGMQ